MCCLWHSRHALHMKSGQVAAIVQASRHARSGEKQRKGLHRGRPAHSKRGKPRLPGRPYVPWLAALSAALLGMRLLRQR
jgi:hypothetical protein